MVAWVGVVVVAVMVVVLVYRGGDDDDEVVGGDDDESGFSGRVIVVEMVMMSMSWWCGGVCVHGKRGRADGGCWPEAAPKIGGGEYQYFLKLEYEKSLNVASELEGLKPTVRQKIDEALLALDNKVEVSDRERSLVTKVSKLQSRNGYSKNRKKAVKIGQTRTQERKSKQRAEKRNVTQALSLVETHKGNATVDCEETQGMSNLHLRYTQKKHNMSYHGLPRW
ncbi:hypothetical protein Tco_1538036 [Tanacetum coccineum]